MKWRWYHFYFLLALFDVLAIAASLALLHWTLDSYQVALGRWSTIDARKRWVTNLRLALIELNAPGNDVFETRDVVGERARFEQLKTHLHLLVRQDKSFDVDLAAFRGFVDQMIQEEERIFANFTEAKAEPARDHANDASFQQASTAMAAMDRAQASAMNELSVFDRALLLETQTLLVEHEQNLKRAATIEKFFFGSIVIALLGVFYFGRTLQRTYDRMVEDQKRVALERQDRLASVGEVCSAVAHGIRNPLAAISSSAQLALRFGTLDEATRLRVQDVLAESQRLDRRIGRLLDFSRVSTQPLEPFELQRLIDQAIDEVKPRLDERNTRVEKSVGTESMVIHGHRERLVQAIIELLSNSMDHMPQGGTIRVNCRRVNGATSSVIVDIIDDGPGIPEKIRERVFDLFFTSKAEGHGIGLASVKRAVEFHGGQVRVVPRDGRGAHIEIVLPLG